MLIWGRIKITRNFLFFANLNFSKFNFSINNGKNIQNSNNISRNELKKMLDKKDNVVKQQVKGSGPGGQHVNKTASTVLLKDKQTGIGVKVGNSRDSIVNSGIAKKRLVDKLDFHYNGSESKIAKKIAKIQKQKSKRKERSVAKHGGAENPENK